MKPNSSAREFAEMEEREFFQFDGFWTHYTCPECGYNDFIEGDARGDEVKCDGCGLEGMVAP